ncbi:MAG: hypothetical protein IJQ02_06200 [Oscillospiraceae bacterium]|nr:hypothetical protein [Oscillospiraceae bacterium]
MKNNRTTALLMLLVFLVVVAVVIIFLTGLDRDSSRRNDNFENVTNTAILETPVVTPSPDPTTVPTTAPTYYAPATSAPAATVRPIQTAAPAAPAAPASTPTPSPTPVTDENGVVMLPAQDLIPIVPGVNDNQNNSDNSGSTVVIPSGTSLGSGSFRSDTGVSLNIRADWSAVVSGDNSVDVTVSVYAEHFSLQTTATPGALNIALGKQYVSLSSPAIVQENNIRTDTLINQNTFRVNLAGGESLDELPLAVEWAFRGSYSGKDLDAIECGGTISLHR